jgi:23S rRNA pseudouridine1911/1915/1917 synthase
MASPYPPAVGTGPDLDTDLDSDLDTDLEPDLEDGLDLPTAAAGGERHRLAVPADLAGERLDRVLAQGLAGAGLSRSRLKALVEEGRVSADGATIDDASYRVKGGQWLEVAVPPAVEAEPAPEAIPLTILYEDDDLLVLDKPAGLVVHPAAGNPAGTLVNALLAHCGDRLSGIGGVRRPGIVHRLDKDTSGLMVVAKNDRAHHGLAAQFADRTLSRTYQALAWGAPGRAEGTITGNIGRSAADRKRMAVLAHGGKPAETDYRVLRRYGRAACLLECRLRTGRTHQVRVHLAHIGHPLVGDAAYGGTRQGRSPAGPGRGLPEPLRAALAAFPRQALHAVGLRFIHPVGGQAMTFASPLPADIQHLVDSLESL